MMSWQAGYPSAALGIVGFVCYFLAFLLWIEWQAERVASRMTPFATKER